MRLLTIFAGMVLAVAGFAEVRAAPLASVTGLANAAVGDTPLVKVQGRGGARFRGGGGGVRRWPRASARGYSGGRARGSVRRRIPSAGARSYARGRPPSGARVAGLNSRRQLARRGPSSVNTVQRRRSAASTARLRRPRPGINRRPGAVRRSRGGRPDAGQRRRISRGGHHAGGPRHYRRGWHRGEPRWRGQRRFHRGRYWRHAYDGWYYWGNNAWFWAPSFGIIVAAGYPYYGDDYAYGYLEPWSDEWFLYCSNRYRSFDPATGYFVTYGGERRFCVFVG